MRDSFIFYKSFYDSISRIKSKELKADIYEAICELALNNNDIELSNDVGLMIMDLIKPQLLANTKKYQDGKKGGRPTKKTSGYEKGKTGGYENKKPNVNVNDNENVNDNANVNDNENVNDNANVNGDDLFTYTQQQFGRMLSSAEIELVKTWEDSELTRYAIKKTILARASSLKYTQGILNSYKQKGITTVLEAEKEEQEFEKKKQEPKKSVKEQKYEEQIKMINECFEGDEK